MEAYKEEISRTAVEGEDRVAAVKAQEKGGTV